MDIRSKGETGKLLDTIGTANMEEVVRLINRGANVNAVSKDGETPLISAAKNNPNPDILRILLENDADVAFESPKGCNALYHAEKNEKMKGTDAYNLLRERTLSKTN